MGGGDHSLRRPQGDRSAVRHLDGQHGVAAAGDGRIGRLTGTAAWLVDDDNAAAVALVEPCPRSPVDRRPSLLDVTSVDAEVAVADLGEPDHQPLATGERLLEADQVPT
jgi:hypothetical protein